MMSDATDDDVDHDTDCDHGTDDDADDHQSGVAWSKHARLSQSRSCKT